MGGRRALYLALLIGAAILHFAYGQYVTHYILLFLLIIPVLSVILTLPTAIRARADLIGGADVCRGRKTSVRLCFDTFGALPPEELPRILASGDRSQAGPTAPPEGLCLEKIDLYPEGFPEGLW